MILCYIVSTFYQLIQRVLGVTNVTKTLIVECYKSSQRIFRKHTSSKRAMSYQGIHLREAYRKKSYFYISRKRINVGTTQA